MRAFVRKLPNSLFYNTIYRVSAAALFSASVSVSLPIGDIAWAQGQRHIASPRSEAHQERAGSGGSTENFPPPPAGIGNGGAGIAGGDTAGAPAAPVYSDSAASPQSGAALWPSVAASQNASLAGSNAGSAAEGGQSSAVPTAAAQSGAAEQPNLQQLQMQIQSLQNKLQSLEQAGGQAAGAVSATDSAGSATAQGGAAATLPQNTVSAADDTVFGGDMNPDDENYSVPSNMPADTIYQTAQDEMAIGHYSKAGALWKAFSERFGTDARAGTAAFQVGECYYAKGLYGQAAKAYLDVRQRYPNEPFTAQVLLQLALSMSNLQDKQTACATLKQLKKQYPHADAVILEQGEQVGARLQCL